MLPLSKVGETFYNDYTVIPDYGLVRATGCRLS